MAKKTQSGCRCPEGSVRIKTPRGRGFVCRSKTPLKGKKAFRPWVAAVGCK